MHLANVSWGGVADAVAIMGALLAIWPLVRASTRRAIMRRRLTQSLDVLRVLRASGTDRPSTAALSRALEEVVDESAIYLTVIEHNWIRRTRSMFRVVLSIAISAAAINGLLVLASTRRAVEVPIFERSIILVVVVLLYGLAILAVIREQLIRRQRKYVVPAIRMNATDGPTVTISVPTPTGPAAG